MAQAGVAAALVLLLGVLAKAGPAYQPYAPWTAPAGTLFPYKAHVNDLKALVDLQRKFGEEQGPNTHWVSVVAPTESYDSTRRLLLNAVYTLSRFGKQESFIVPIFLPGDGLEACLKDNLPCYNGTSHWDSGQHLGNRESYWARHVLAWDILKMGVNVHMVDVDQVFFRPVVKSLVHTFDHLAPDAIFDLDEEAPPADKRGWISLINPSSYAIAADVRSVNFMTVWIKRFIDNDRNWLGHIHEVGYVLCNSYATCVSARRKGLAAIYRAPMMFNRGPNVTLGTTNCISRSALWDDNEWCWHSRLHIHLICQEPSNAFHHATEAWTHHKLWFVDDTPKAEPLYADVPAGEPGGHPHLPCRHFAETAWEDRLMLP